MNRVNFERIQWDALRSGLCTGGEWGGPGEEDEEEEIRMGMPLVRRQLPRILKQSLTPRQLEYVTLYFFQGMNMPAIAKELQVNKSSVQRGLAAAKRNLKKTLQLFL